MNVAQRAIGLLSGPERIGGLGVRRWACALVGAAFVLCLSGCAFLRAQRVGRVCTVEAAREAGARDGARGRSPAEDYAEICGPARASLNRIYQESYDETREPATEAAR